MRATEETECKTKEDPARAHGDRQRSPRRGRVGPEPTGAHVQSWTSKPGIG